MSEDIQNLIRRIEQDLTKVETAHDLVKNTNELVNRYLEGYDKILTEGISRLSEDLKKSLGESLAEFEEQAKAELLRELYETQQGFVSNLHDHISRLMVFFQYLNSLKQDLEDSFGSKIEPTFLKLEESLKLQDGILDQLKQFDLPRLWDILEDHRNHSQEVLQSFLSNLNEDFVSGLNDYQHKLSDLDRSLHRFSASLDLLGVIRGQFAEQIDRNGAIVKETKNALKEIIEELHSTAQGIKNAGEETRTGSLDVIRQFEERTAGSSDQLLDIFNSLKIGMAEYVERQQKKLEEKWANFEAIPKQLNSALTTFENVQKRRIRWVVSLLVINFVLVLLFLVSQVWTREIPFISGNIQSDTQAGNPDTTNIQGQADSISLGTNITNETESNVNIIDTSSFLSPTEAENQLGQRARNALIYLQDGNFDRLLQKYIHPEGLLIIDQNLERGKNLVTFESLLGLSNDDKGLFTWNIGVGPPLSSTLRSFFKDHIIDRDFKSSKGPLVNHFYPVLTEEWIPFFSNNFPGSIFASFDLGNDYLILLFQKSEVSQEWLLRGILRRTT